MQLIKTFESRYAITPTGKVWSIRSKKFLKPYKMKRGYLVVDLCVNWKVKRYLVHRLVALTFIPNPRAKKQVNHKDGNKEHNHLSNLEWATNLENRRHAIESGLINFKGENSPVAKLTNKQVVKLREMAASGKYTFRRLGNIFGICPQSAHNIARRKTYPSVL